MAQGFANARAFLRTSILTLRAPPPAHVPPTAAVPLSWPASFIALSNIMLARLRVQPGHRAAVRAAAHRCCSTAAPAPAPPPLSLALVRQGAADDALSATTAWAADAAGVLRRAAPAPGARAAEAAAAEAPPASAPLRTLLLPYGYPVTVAESYAGYASWAFGGGVFSSAAGVLACVVMARARARVRTCEAAARFSPDPPPPRARLPLSSTQSLLMAIGVGAGASVPLAAALNWVLKDGCVLLRRPAVQQALRCRCSPPRGRPPARPLLRAAWVSLAACWPPR